MNNRHFPQGKQNLKESCLFCNPSIHDQTNQVLLKSNNFYIFAGLGPLVEGYFIITPHKCNGDGGLFQSFSGFSAHFLEEFEFLSSLIGEFYRAIYQTEDHLQFEHGRAGTCYPRGSDTLHCFHAHMCCFPRSHALWKKTDLYQFEEIVGLSKVSAAVGQNPYLWIRRNHINHNKPYGAAEREVWENRVAVIEDNQKVPSQYLRKIFAEFEKLDPGLFDWAVSPRKEIVDKTIGLFKDWIKKNKRLNLKKDEKGIFNLDFVDSISLANRDAYDMISSNFDKVWKENIIYGAVGKFLACFRDNTGKKRTFLDCGCGPGHYLNIFASIGVNAVGIDLSINMLKSAKKNAPEGNSIKMNFFKLGFKRNSFDGIWCNAVFVHIPQKKTLEVLKDLNRILKPGSILFLSTQLGTDSVVRREGRIFFYYNQELLFDLCNKAGFRKVDSWDGQSNIGSQKDTRLKKWILMILKKGN